MAKNHITISVETQSFQDFQELVGKGNVSPTLNSFMENYIATQKADKKGIKKKILLMEIDKLVKDVAEFQAELNSKKELLRQIEEAEAEEKKEKLLKEEERIKANVSCINCGNQIEQHDLNKFTFKKGNVCKGCYMNSSSENVKKWNEVSE